MKRLWAGLLAGVLLVGNLSYALAQSLLPNAEQQFVDGNGVPYAGGSVTFYIPNTTTPKNTWSDAGLSVLNSNPVVLDGAGRAIIWGQGNYRQILKDGDGNTIWDQVTSAGSTFAGGGISTGSAPNYILTLSTAPALVQGSTLSWRASFTSQGADTLNVNSGGAKPLYKASPAGQIPISAGDVQSGQDLITVYDTALASGAGGWSVVGGIVPALTTTWTASSATLGANVWGQTFTYLGTVATTLNLPALAGTTAGLGFRVVNAGTATVTVDPNAAETIAGGATYPVTPGGSLDVIAATSTWKTATGSGLVLLESKTASAAASLTFTSRIDSTYDEYLLVVSGVVSSSNNDSLDLRVSEDAGANWKSGGSDYSFNIQTMATGAIASAGGTTSSIVLINAGVSNAAASQVSAGEFRIFQPGVNGIFKQTLGDFSNHTSGGLYLRNTGAGAYIGSTAPVNGLQLFMATGNITAAASLYGVRK